MKFLFAILFFSVTLQACTCVQMTPEEQERARERRAELLVMRPMGREK